jgi:hypothetical protein
MRRGGGAARHRAARSRRARDPPARVRDAAPRFHQRPEVGAATARHRRHEHRRHRARRRPVAAAGIPRGAKHHAGPDRLPGRPQRVQHSARGAGAGHGHRPGRRRGLRRAAGRPRARPTFDRHGGQVLRRDHRARGPASRRSGARGRRDRAPGQLACRAAPGVASARGHRDLPLGIQLPCVDDHGHGGRRRHRLRAGRRPARHALHRGLGGPAVHPRHGDARRPLGAGLRRRLA